MKNIVILLVTFCSLAFVFLQLSKAADAGMTAFPAEVFAQTAPTPPQTKETQIKSSPSSEPTPERSPASLTTPVANLQPKNQQQELTEAEELRRKIARLPKKVLPLEEIGGPSNYYDPDLDKVPTAYDNCWLVSNPDNKDSDDDGVGDACDPDLVDTRLLDWDGDGVSDEKDNCPRVCNQNQRDSNRDGIGDRCNIGGRFIERCKKRRKIRSEKWP